MGLKEIKKTGRAIRKRKKAYAEMGQAHVQT